MFDNTDTREIPTIAPRRSRRWLVIAVAGALVMATGLALALWPHSAATTGVDLASDAEASATLPEPSAEPVPSASALPTDPDAAAEGGAAEPAEPTEPVEPKEPVEPVEPKEPAEPKEPGPEDNAAPVIGWIKTPPNPIYEHSLACSPITAKVRAQLSDNVGVVNPRVVYFIPGTGVVEVPMTLNSFGNYVATVANIPQDFVPAGEGEKLLTVGVVAEDAAGNVTEDHGWITVTGDSCMSLG